MRIIDHHKSSFGSSDLSVERLHLLDGEGITIEDEILEVLGIVQVRPEDVHWESVVREFRVSLHHQVHAVFFVLAVVVAQTVNWWQRRVAGDL